MYYNINWPNQAIFWLWSRWWINCLPFDHGHPNKWLFSWASFNVLMLGQIWKFVTSSSTLLNMQINSQAGLLHTRHHTKETLCENVSMSPLSVMLMFVVVGAIGMHKYLSIRCDDNSRGPLNDFFLLHISFKLPHELFCSHSLTYAVDLIN